MPPKARISRDMIINGAFDVIRTDGAPMLNARNIAKRLNCSTQPILYYFSSMDEVKLAAYKKADDYHTSFITNVKGEYPNPLMEIGMRYIGFAATEKELFKFLFQTDQFKGKTLAEMIDADELLSILQMISQAMSLSSEQAKALFELLFLAAHGIASLLANNGMVFDEQHIQSILADTFQVGILIMKTKGEKK